MEEKLIVCQGLTKQYGLKRAVDELDLTLGRGRIIGLLGPNGSGKTTWIKLLCGLIQPTRGTVTIDGHTPDTYTKSIISYLPDRMYFADWMNAGDLLDYFSDFYPDFDRQKAENMCTSLGILKKDRIKSMSKGTKEKLQLAMVMSRKAQLYLLDEPIAGVDPAAREYILNTILTNYSPEATVIIAVIYVVMRFYQGLLKDEGYLTFTLPVSIDAILWAKALSGLILLAISGVVCVLSLGMLLRDTLNFREIGIAFRAISAYDLLGTVITTLLSALVAAVASGLSSLFQAYLSMGLGQMAKKRKLATSILAYVLISIGVSTLTTTVLMPLGNWILGWTGYGSMWNAVGEQGGISILLLLTALVKLAYTAVYYVLSRYIFKHKLNLE